MLRFGIMLHGTDCFNFVLFVSCRLVWHTRLVSTSMGSEFVFVGLASPYRRMLDDSAVA
jgi:hypothetical protein